ncbi:YicC family protein [Thiomicrorhabdus sp. ZW0627]|uniref:YicC/YloC family endoribonuclease n=1 Tax=Thiomicrorhabdus sp. ZW0627 TaxID=3039774 RepID=UPI0024373421|nr:YicC/YloC family endoribonuclease [Thiomicrorhabdus sp. ZW0627]MDG6774353.1 YicC family protein [Thiomicrorhabdus sp. ZW0627]
MKSMTAFARTQNTADWGNFSWEIRSVNQRFLETYFKLPENQRHLEMKIREQIKHNLHRGKVEVTLRVSDNQSQQAFKVNQSVLQPLSQAICEVQQTLMEATQVNPLEVLNWPGVLGSELVDESALEQQEAELFEGLQNTLNALNENRLREGSALKAIILERCDAIAHYVDEAQRLLPEIIATQTEKLRERILTLVEEFDEMRLHQEVAILAQKLDVQEELDRLRTHLTEVRHVMESKDAIGRRLDFLMQELNREANTLGSKSADSRTSQISVELKVLIEQMREQVQNIE